MDFFMIMTKWFWLLFRGGAEMLVKHPGLFNVGFQEPTHAEDLLVSVSSGWHFRCDHDVHHGCAGPTAMRTHRQPSTARYRRET